MYKFTELDTGGLNILVIGDLMLDHYIYGDCSRISPEAPVPVVEIRSESHTLGGAGNVIENLNVFGCNVNIVSIVGDDENAGLVLKKLSHCNIKGDGLVADKNRCTTIKTRVLATKHQLIRLDKEVTKPIDNDIETKLLALIKQILPKYQMVLLSDYNKGLLTPNLLEGVFEACKVQNIKTIVDPKGINFDKYKGVSIIKPNKKEAVAATGIAIADKTSLQEACAKIKEITNCEDVIITMSEEGMALYSDNKLTIIPTKAIGVVDVTGAGDTVLASLGIALTAGYSLEQACDFANHAAAVVVSKIGSATATLDEIKKKFEE
ncbi:D-glycero-beta-D-manno-heptose-7-phosphate kinase [Mucilaginibacter sp. HMF5004]|uniref:D-glycero-beta-D-manno-heptose-7-phosphate kinase n=1 Tax=Mucilaginibacter rivuli TaxID=2857527 RepID=UPI001C5E35A9|nr:D-glycero-beta-D-manno-heptose-7-phosphate kinase [Mucilaginibacter rivuli]MBW4889880.1 D-glycero-beta-D-manno-heptose-7-phosphate kinase [Mucilaginibacter rivuli]